MKFRADAGIDYVSRGSTILHAHVRTVLEALDLGLRHALCHNVVSHIHRVDYSWDRYVCVAHKERVHLRAQTEQFDNRIALCLVFEIAQFSGV